jgi:hypothetical protein
MNIYPVKCRNTPFLIFAHSFEEALVPYRRVTGSGTAGDFRKSLADSKDTPTHIFTHILTGDKVSLKDAQVAFKNLHKYSQHAPERPVPIPIELEKTSEPEPEVVKIPTPKETLKEILVSKELQEAFEEINTKSTEISIPDIFA